MAYFNMRILIENEQHEIFMRQENIKFYANEISKILIFLQNVSKVLIQKALLVLWL
jgi:hypothetical protein